MGDGVTRADMLGKGSSRLREIAEQDPDRVAVEVADRQYRYGETDRLVDGMAQRLLNDVGDGASRVGVRLSDPYAVAVCTLAVERAGMTRVLIDPTAPLVRVEDVIGRVKPSLVLSDVPGDEALSVAVHDPLDYQAPPPVGGISMPQSPVPSVNFTSGSTGSPKGILKSASQQDAMMEQHVPQHLRPTDGTYLKYGAISTGSAFFFSGWLRTIFVIGGTASVYEIRRRGVARLAQWLLDSCVVSVTLIPTILRQVERELPEHLIFPSLRCVFLGGEAVTWEDVRALRRHLLPGAQVRNTLIQTEVGIAAFVVEGDVPADASGSLPVGLPFPGSTLSIVDPDGQPLPRGLAGEIVVETADAAWGYWEQPELTARVFTKLPHGRRRVRTGDAGRIREDGLLEHLGRIDHVVQVAGNRVDLGDVETALRRLDGVADAAVKPVTSDAGDLRLAGFVVPQLDAALHPQLMRSQLARRLPSAMLPDSIQILPELPRLIGGKVDRVALPDRPRVDPSQHRQPETDLERDVARVMATVLNLGEVGADDDFFLLGGDSLSAVELFIRLNDELGIDRPVSLIVEAPTVSTLAAAYRTDSDPWQELVPVSTRGTLPPLFVIHDGMGDVMYALKLKEGLGSEQPVYALRPRELTGVAQEPRTLEDVAAGYVDEICRIWPREPYLLYGYSLGGMIAYEMGCQLQSAGRRVGLVALGDTHAPSTSEPSQRLVKLARLRERSRRSGTGVMRNALARVKYHADMTLRVSNAEARDRQRQLKRDSAERRPVAMRSRPDFVARTYATPMASYRPAGRYDGPLLLLRGRSNVSPDLEWSHWVTRPIDIVNIDAAHDEFHEGQHATEVAEALRRHIDRILAVKRVTALRG